MKPRQPLRRLLSIARRLRRAAACRLPLAVAAGMVLLAGGCGAADEPAARAGSAAAAESAAPEVGVTLDAEDQRRLGIVTMPLATAEYEEHVEGTGVVMAALSVIERMAALDTAEAAMRKSQAALERARNLFKAGIAVSRETLEGAQSQAAADTAQLQLARTQAAAAFGYDAPWLADGRRTSILDALSAGRAAVVRASFPGGLPGGVPPRIVLDRVGAAADSSWTSTEVWLGPADPAVPGPVLLAYVDGDGAALISGERVVALVGTGKTQQGVIVPSSAIVIAGGAPWCYALEGEDHFARVRVELGRPVGDGYFHATPSLAPGRRVVVSGAGLLLAAETGGAEEED